MLLKIEELMDSGRWSPCSVVELEYEENFYYEDESDDDGEYVWFDSY